MEVYSYTLKIDPLTNGYQFCLQNNLSVFSRKCFFSESVATEKTAGCDENCGFSLALESRY